MGEILNYSFERSEIWATIRKQQKGFLLGRRYIPFSHHMNCIILAWRDEQVFKSHPRETPAAARRHDSTTPMAVGIPVSAAIGGVMCWADESVLSFYRGRGPDSCGHTPSIRNRAGSPLLTAHWFQALITASKGQGGRELVYTRCKILCTVNEKLLCTQRRGV